jgi:hypothetical protein
MNLIICGSIAIYLGHDTAGATIITTTLVSMAGTFIYATESRRRERSEKQEAVTGAGKKKK